MAANSQTDIVSGRVVNERNQPVSGVKVDLWTKGGVFEKSTKSDGDGAFSITHPRIPQRCYLEVVAPDKLRLARAIVEDIPGDESLSVLVSLKKGYLVSGRVMTDGKGLKGLIVKAFSRDSRRGERVHGGGAVLTGRGGKFELILTPGAKSFVVTNNRYKSLIGEKEVDVDVTRDGDIGAIELGTRGR